MIDIDLENNIFKSSQLVLGPRTLARIFQFDFILNDVVANSKRVFFYKN